jgi:hypothetical protein
MHIEETVLNMGFLLYPTIICCQSSTALFTVLSHCAKPAVHAHNRAAAASIKPQLLDAIITVNYSILKVMRINTLLKTAMRDI